MRTHFFAHCKKLHWNLERMHANNQGLGSASKHEEKKKFRLFCQELMKEKANE